MTLQREFHGFNVIDGKVVSTWTALELSNPADDPTHQRPHSSPYQTHGEFKLRWEDATTRYLLHDQHSIYHLHTSDGKLHIWNTTYHPLPPPAYTIEAIANADVPVDMAPQDFLREFGFRDINEMYQDLGSPQALERYGIPLMDILYQVLDRMQGAMAEMRNRAEERG